MKHIYIVGILLLSSCGIDKSESVNQTTSRELIEDDSVAAEVKVKNEEPLPETYETEPMTFDLGRENLLIDTCAFYYACDCCSGDLILKSDLSFYDVNYCMSDVSLTYGSYELLNDTLTLNFDGTCVKKEYNWANEVDTSAVNYFITDTLLNSSTRQYIATNCGEKVKLTKIDGDEVGVESGEDYQDLIKTLEQNGLIPRLTDIVKKLQSTPRSSQLDD